MNLRRSIYEILKKWKSAKELMRNDLNIGMSQTSEEIKHQNIAVEHAY